MPSLAARRSAGLAALTVLLSLQFLIPPVPASSNVQEVASGLDTPWSLDFAKDGTIYVTERSGTIRTVRQGVLDSQPRATINVKTFVSGEAGLLGLALDPNFETNRAAYVYYSYTDSQGRVLNRISKLTEVNGRFENEQVLLDGIKGTNIHDGGRLRVGPDGKLYATTGDAADGLLAQDPFSLNGKILRLNLDGRVPSDNPNSTSPVYSLGHRNPQGITWDTAGHLVESEHGPTSFPGPCCNDEINLIEPGGNYGWPYFYGVSGNATYTDPILSTGSDTWAPSGMTFYSSPNIPEWTGKFLVATLRGEHLRVLDIGFSPSAHVVSSEPFLSGSYGRLRDVVQGPDGFVYVITSNRDGRGTPAIGDDKILKITGASGSLAGVRIPAYVVYTGLIGAAGLSLLVLVILRKRRAQVGSIQGKFLS